ncbi:protein rep [Photorhabdus heterorhabditis]|uniref:Uncharacterized protein n=1 Tax=Photorhabdus heterorhabditis TaxID=880156 RepID=A0A5B0VKR9_9GAMM|nr:protein rep [Photorhabdus heterorhabditis]KAA1174611.1 hypothetical protein F0L16_20835 [Photorhabdus heterorhabditis]
MTQKRIGAPSRYICEVTSRPPVGELVDHSTGEIFSFIKQSDATDARRERFKLLDASAGVLRMFFGDNPPIRKNGSKKLHRTCDCHRVTVTPTAQILKSEERKKAFFGGVAQCGSVWTCPICAAKINERKAAEMRIAFNQAPALAVRPHLVTFTAPHDAGDSIEELTMKIREALAAFWRERQVAKWKKSRGVVGNIRSFEVRYGRNGWHPHFHLIIFSHNSLLEDTAILLEKWQACCVRVGLSMPNEYGLDIQDGSKAGEYICKFGSDGEILNTKSGSPVNWDAADEMTKGNTKKGKQGSLSPWDLLRGISEAENDEERQRLRILFLFYARAMKGVSQVKWSRGLRQFFELEPEKSDEEIVSEVDDSAKLLCHITLDEWRYLVKSCNRATVLELAENGGSRAVARFLFGVLYGGEFEAFYRSFLHRQDMLPDSSILVPK